MTGYAIQRPATAFSLSGSRKRPRHTSEAHLKSIRQLACVICLKRPVEAAHIRTKSPLHGKRETGISEKSSDIWVLPLCVGCHRTDRDSQHNIGETEFYKRHGIDQFATALALWAAGGDEELMERIVIEARTRHA